MMIEGFFERYKNDLSAGMVVFFVALPLCLGIALASGAPLFSGVIAGIVGGIVIGLASKSPLGVSGPAAGLVVIVLTAIEQLGSWDVFLLAVFLAGILQILMGYARLGVIAYYFPSSVIKGMLTGIGLLIIMKQIPFALGYRNVTETGDADDQISAFAVLQDSLFEITHAITPSAILITVLSLIVLILWDTVLSKKHRVFQIVQGPLVVVVMGIGFTLLFKNGVLPFVLNPDQLVKLPVIANVTEFLGQFTLPDFSALTNPRVYMVALTIAIVASLETLLCVEATDKLDPEKRVTPTNRELKAQGLGNMISGLIGGLPLTQVIVRSSANISFGAKSKVSTIIHGLMLLVCAYAIPVILNLIPLASLACILILVGYKLAKPSVFKTVYNLGWSQFLPFLATVLGVVFIDLLKGIGLGLVIAIFYILRNNRRNSFDLVKDEQNGKANYTFVLSEEMSFLSKANLLQELGTIPDHAYVTIDGTKSRFVDFDILEMIEDFKASIANRHISLQISGLSWDKLA